MFKAFSKMQAITSQFKVTLTSWERLSNAPIPLAGASAVQWNDYVFVLAYNGMALLYHTKSKIWSALPTAPYTSTNTTPPPLTSHNGQILTMSKKGEMATFDPQIGNWRRLSDMNLATKTKRNYVIILASYNRNLYAIIGLDKERSEIEFKQTKDCCTIFLFNSNSEWMKVHEFGEPFLQSVAIINSTVFVYAGGKIHKILLKVEQNKRNQGFDQIWSKHTTDNTIQDLAQPVEIGVLKPFGFFVGQQLTQQTQGLTFTSQPKHAIQQPIKTSNQIASPPYEGFTLYAIKDTLFSFGGRDRDNQPTSDALRYNLDTDTWESAGYMRSARYNVAVTTMQDTTLDVFVLGGSFGSSQYTMKERIYRHDTPASMMGFGAASLDWSDNTSILEMCTVN